ncbi:hypothetical protein COEREDRAFT_88627 [Coemansia reversa NRRL 1564]|uniref:Uncharacterized protein n=1 Tax=Coemansia reversa (strain ATCC 12441 / NRRL 1564) TaxID=763665 RepID=A0A2G5B698_COERN|nr:hypothetical protein COEREDRAFT_88627 [Coemansia reversa NRRL 1564]|eukprot:PIA14530.1 hypothetical protein COEREDRAFT_88627 [Coemansia reversa NRRL 1564]
MSYSDTSISFTEHLDIPNSRNHYYHSSSSRSSSPSPSLSTPPSTPPSTLSSLLPSPSPSPSPLPLPFDISQLVTDEDFEYVGDIVVDGTSNDDTVSKANLIAQKVVYIWIGEFTVKVSLETVFYTLLCNVHEKLQELLEEAVRIFIEKNPGYERDAPKEPKFTQFYDNGNCEGTEMKEYVSPEDCGNMLSIEINEQIISRTVSGDIQLALITLVNENFPGSENSQN